MLDGLPSTSKARQAHAIPCLWRLARDAASPLWRAARKFARFFAYPAVRAIVRACARRRPSSPAFRRDRVRAMLCVCACPSSLPGSHLEHLAVGCAMAAGMSSVSVLRRSALSYPRRVSRSRMRDTCVAGGARFVSFVCVPRHRACLCAAVRAGRPETRAFRRLCAGRCCACGAACRATLTFGLGTLRSAESSRQH